MQRLCNAALQSLSLERGQCERERSYGPAGVTTQVGNDPEVVRATTDRHMITVGLRRGERALEIPRCFLYLTALEGDGSRHVQCTGFNRLIRSLMCPFQRALHPPPTLLVRTESGTSNSVHESQCRRLFESIGVSILEKLDHCSELTRLN
jgi:hypothetical protein